MIIPIKELLLANIIWLVVLVFGCIAYIYKDKWKEIPTIKRVFNISVFVVIFVLYYTKYLH